ncbi:MAG: Rne/Rng family ribonuclease [Bacteroidia bacterium]
MSSELFISSDSSGVTIALTIDKKLTELHQENISNNFSVGDIHLGVINKIMPGLNAAFINVGHEKDAFLHYLDLGPQILSLIKFTKQTQTGNIKHADLSRFTSEPDIEKTGKITQVLGKEKQLMVQIVKEPISTKGPRLSSQISLAGRYLVLVPFSNTISVSKKIKYNEERQRLKQLFNTIRAKNYGVIVRTVAEGASIEDVERDYYDLVEKWEKVLLQLKKAKPPQKILGESDRFISILRDMLNDSFTAIHVSDNYVYQQIKTYVKDKAPHLEKIIKHYNGKEPFFEHFGIEKQIKSSFGKEVMLSGGSYLVIEHTEAMHVIDVNSGAKTKSDMNQENNALAVNLEAAEAIARQLRLRDMGGIIVVDFIDLKNAGNRRLVYEKLKDCMKDDKARHKILPMSQFGVVQITRQRVRPETNVVTTELCPMCNGTGQSTVSILLIDEIEKNLQYLYEELNTRSITLQVHPYIESFLTKGMKSKRFNWFLKFKKWIKIKPVNSYYLSEYHFFDASGDEIKL